MLYCKIKVGDSLRLDSLSSINDQKRPLAGGNGTRHLIRKVHMPRSVDKVEHIFLTLIYIVHLNRVALYRNAFLFLQIHRIEHLILHLPRIESLGDFKHSVCKRALAVVYMRNDAKVSRILHLVKM